MIGGKKNHSAGSRVEKYGFDLTVRAAQGRLSALSVFL
jgi:hypothetical protein